MQKRKRRTQTALPRSGLRRAREAFIPAGLEVLRDELQLEAYDTKELLADARNAVVSLGMSLDNAVKVVRQLNEDEQIKQLLEWLECDPDDPNVWRSAFIKLARIHHSVGRIVHKWSTKPVGRRSWTPEDETILLEGVVKLKGLGCSEREAIRIISEAEVFPHHERRAHERPKGRATLEARTGALWAKLQRIKKNARRGDWLTSGGNTFESTFEWSLYWLENPIPTPPAGGDKRPS
jgi:hypothetical protein